MPDKLGFAKSIGMGASTAGVLGCVGAVIVGGIAALVAGPAAGLTAAVWGASIFGGLGTLLAGFASGMADDSNGGKIMLSGAIVTCALAFGIHGMKPHEPPSPKTSSLDTHISAPFNAKSKAVPETRVLTAFTMKNQTPVWTPAQV